VVEVDLGTLASLAKIVVGTLVGRRVIDWNTEDFSIEASSDGTSCGNGRQRHRQHR